MLPASATARIFAVSHIISLAESVACAPLPLLQRDESGSSSGSGVYIGVALVLAVVLPGVSAVLFCCVMRRGRPGRVSAKSVDTEAGDEKTAASSELSAEAEESITVAVNSIV
ncbi:hypothetical protein MIND_00550400 [Mycena indigotica]|uniref:Uncharacterized protein n=1 Tax=Mycena indigotica TaxID=2126181 RepID=A0A8H6SZK7_9AGAR|nr:uncharacterized protein MIND_00550400 [Mycena indigotica]KAF7307556.1 hypothetical protein MIND_00550400 [Mycena indigotica]